MGSGDRIIYGFDPNMVGFCLTFSRFPFALTVHCIFICWHFSIGFGRGYDQ
jgi:hypothetical protein